MILAPEDVIKLLLAILVGGLIGAEREFRDRAAGFRTIIFITVGSTLFTMLSPKLAGSGDPVRIAASVVSGVGFLGAGVILRDAGRVVGLTTAATIWLAAAMGMAIGGSQFLIAAVGIGLTLLVLWVFPVFEGWIDNIRHVGTYTIVAAAKPGVREALDSLVLDSGLRESARQRGRQGERYTFTWELYGRPAKHTALTESLMAHPDVIEFQS